MRTRNLCFFLLPIFALGCQSKGSDKKSLSSLKEEFQNTILQRDLEEGPFCFNYQYRTVFYSQEIVCLFGELTVVDRLPRGWKQYDSKTLYKDGNTWKEVTIANLFSTEQQMEQLRASCDDQLKRQSLSFFAGESPLYPSLKLSDIQLFVIDSQNLIVIFAPYSVGSSSDGPFTAKIPLKTIQNEWGIKHPFLEHVNRVVGSNDYNATWDPAN